MIKVRDIFLLCLALAAVGGTAARSCGQVAPADPAGAETSSLPLFEQEPYDLVLLNEQDGSGNPKALKVEPLPLVGRRVPKNPSRTAKLELRLWEDPQRLFEIRWSAIRDVRLFEQILLDKAIELAREGKREEAFDYFQFLQQKHPDWPGVSEAIQDYLYREAGLQHTQQKYAAALGLLREVFARNPKYPNLDRALGAANEKLIEQYVAADDFASARELIKTLLAQYPEHGVAVRWELRLKDEANRQLAAAREALSARKFREADEAGRRLMEIWPDTPGAAETIATIQKEYPRIRVGVRALATAVEPRHLDDWAIRRASRLVYRTLTEFAGAGSEGGQYVCPMGVLELDPLGRGLTFQIRAGANWSQGPMVLTGTDVARRVLAMAEPGNPAFEPAWGDLLAGVAVRDVYRVQVDLVRPHVRPDALLQTAVPPHARPAGSQEPILSNGPFVVESRDPDRMVFVANERYFAAVKGQPQEIVEERLVDDRAALRALREGRVLVLDQVFPWTLADFRAVPEIEVRRYAAARVHCLIPNVNRPLMARRTFRRALIYGIHRDAILNHLLGGRQEPGCEAISGPFPKGDSNDPIGYAYDSTIAPRPYEPQLAAVLAGVAVAAQAEADAKRKTATGGKPAAEPPAAAPAAPTETAPAQPEAPAADAANNEKKPADRKTVSFSVPLTLAHPPDPVARVACAKIKEQLAIVGIQVSLVELPPGPVVRVPDDADLLYAALPLWEPVVDAPRLLDADGPSGGASAYMRLALRQLRQATDWQQVRPQLREIHRIAHFDAAVIPLWQLVDHFACHRSLSGAGGRPVSLYQNVEQWQAAPQAAAEAK
ncbi:MAG: hypothetical protein JW809_17660 [Pirellulales bacterium]|nr:hypothetical protein [Pirellulales bacterium]